VFLAMASPLVWGYCEPMKQTTGFARLPDGRRIAYAVVGSGPAVVLPAWWASHVVEDWHFDPLRRFVEGLAAERMVVRYDRLGTGLSDRERPAETFTPEFEDATLCAVLTDLGLERMTLMGISCGGCIAVSFAARRPERVDRLVLYGSYADGRALAPPQARAGLIDLVRSHWGLVSRGPGGLHRVPARSRRRRRRCRAARADLPDRRARRAAAGSCACAGGAS
jgi:pimeloyl-ACP methyl ester carboxylesterase